MIVFKNPDLDKDSNIIDNVVYTVGNFDGLHKGHKYLLDQVLEYGAKNRLKTGVITFEKHPKIGKNFIGHLSCINEKESYFKRMGFDFVIFLNFDRIKSVEFDTFIYYLYDNFHLRTLILGKDNRIGKDGKGDVSTLKETFSKNVDIIEVDFIRFAGDKISSSTLRELLLQGRISHVNSMLEEPYKIYCNEESGRGVGREIGAPTINLRPIDPEKIIPKDGVYAVELCLDDKTSYIGACNIGLKPTFNCTERTIEVHVLDEFETLEADKFCIRFLEFIREEKKFRSIEELKFNINKDIDKIRRITGGNSNES